MWVDLWSDLDVAGCIFKEKVSIETFHLPFENNMVPKLLAKKKENVMVIKNVKLFLSRPLSPHKLHLRRPEKCYQMFSFLCKISTPRQYLVHMPVSSWHLDKHGMVGSTWNINTITIFTRVSCSSSNNFSSLIKGI